MTMRTPLAGKRIVLTRAREQMTEFAQLLEANGAEVLYCSAIQTLPPDDWQAFDRALSQIERFDWLLATSTNAVRAVFERYGVLGLPCNALDQLKIAAIGKATAKLLTDFGHAPDFVPHAYVAEQFLAEFQDVAGQRIFLPQADIARPLLRESLTARGAEVTALVAYRTVPDPQVVELAELLRQQHVDVVTFTSSSTVRYTIEALHAAGMRNSQEFLNQTIIASIGPITSQTALDLGLHVDIEAAEHSTQGLVEALVEWANAEKELA
ncbi:uroporphyrinogen-III synthase [Herpetosiphon geysericola]|uniref:uroporphyrinogen-III synthase n=1 Tax=Herpetosiphon geysericola TaxID=70996 RepID=UPI0006C91F2F|nr:uroporphyrinogen-III synthase [Herpetosiphon geysericola]